MNSPTSRLPEASARATWNSVSYSLNSAGVRVRSSIRSRAARIRALSSVLTRTAAMLAAQRSIMCLAWTTSAMLKLLSPTCNRRRLVIASLGAAAIVAPASGPLPLRETTTPMASSTRSASRTEVRLTPSRLDSWRSPGNRSPARNCPATICSSI